MSITPIAKFINSQIVSRGGDAIPIDQLINIHNYQANVNQQSLAFARQMIVRGSQIGLTLRTIYPELLVSFPNIDSFSTVNDFLGSESGMNMLTNSLIIRTFFISDTAFFTSKIVSTLGLNENEFSNFKAITDSNIAMQSLIQNIPLFAFLIRVDNGEYTTALLTREVSRSIIFNNPELLEIVFSSGNSVVDRLFNNRAAFHAAIANNTSLNAILSGDIHVPRIIDTPAFFESLRLTTVNFGRVIDRLNVIRGIATNSTLSNMATFSNILNNNAASNQMYLNRDTMIAIVRNSITFNSFIHATWNIGQGLMTLLPGRTPITHIHTFSNLITASDIIRGEYILSLASLFPGSSIFSLLINNISTMTLMTNNARLFLDISHNSTHRLMVQQSSNALTGINLSNRIQTVTTNPSTNFTNAATLNTAFVISVQNTSNFAAGNYEMNRLRDNVATSQEALFTSASIQPNSTTMIGRFTFSSSVPQHRADGNVSNRNLTVRFIQQN